MVTVKTSPDHPSSMAEREMRRMANSGAGANPDVTVKAGKHILNQHNTRVKQTGDGGPEKAVGRSLSAGDPVKRPS